MAKSKERIARTDVPALAPWEFARWIWHQLTSMRTALFLLFLLALAAIPGSIIPQKNVDAQLSAQWRLDHKTLTPIYDKLQLFSVYTSVWFSAIYILLMISLVGCVLPRLLVYWKGMRAKPPAAPKNLARMRAHRSWGGSGEAAVDTVDTVANAAALLRRRRFRVVVAPDGNSVAGERGYLREAGNLLFHFSVLVVLVGVAASKLLGFEGGVIVVEGNGFANSLSQYDDFNAGSLYNPDSLKPFSFAVSDFKVSYVPSGREQGMAHEFDATVRYQTKPGAATKTASVSVNHPLTIDGTQVYLISDGYAPDITVRDGKGKVVYSGPTVFLPANQSFESTGVVKVPDSQYANGQPLQIGLQGIFYPTFVCFPETGPISAFPDLKNPAVSLALYTGDLGLNDGTPQDIYTLDMAGLKPVPGTAQIGSMDSCGMKVTAASNAVMRVDLMDGETAVLPNGMGSITLNGVSRFVDLQISQAPYTWVALLGMCMALLGLIGSLFIRPRRIWVRRSPETGLVEIAALDRSSSGDPRPEVDNMAKQLGMPDINAEAETETTP